MRRKMLANESSQNQKKEDNWIDLNLPLWTFQATPYSIILNHGRTISYLNGINASASINENIHYPHKSFSWAQIHFLKAFNKEVLFYYDRHSGVL